MLGFIAGMLYGNMGEWLVHKNFLHEDGRKKNSFWSFHWNEHHKACRRNDFHDQDYNRSLLDWNAQSKEVAGLLLAGVLHAPLFPLAPTFVSGLWFQLTLYYNVHKKAHLDPQWAKENIPWHYDHHMGPNQDKNWCITYPFFDYVMGTREPYLGTQKALADLLRREAKAA
jgi:hypothetical protein